MSFPRSISQGTTLGDALHALVQPTTPPAVGATLVWDGTKYVPQAPAAAITFDLQALDPVVSDYATLPLTVGVYPQLARVGAWTNNSPGDLVVPVTGVYRVEYTWAVTADATVASVLSFQVNSDSSDATVPGGRIPVPDDGRDYRGVTVRYVSLTAGQSVGGLQVRQDPVPTGDTGVQVSVSLSQLPTG